MISAGAIVTLRQHGTILWIVRGPAPGGRWYVTAKRVDESGRGSYQNHVAGAGDITVIRDAPSYQIGEREGDSVPSNGYTASAGLLAGGAIAGGCGSPYSRS
jgi:hypothetical protein